MKNRYYTLNILKNVVFLSFLLFAFGTQAKGVLFENEFYNINLDKATIDKGYTVNGFDELKMSLVPGILNEATDVEIVKINEEMEMPWELEKISNIFQFEFKNKKAYDNHKPFYIQFHYSKESFNGKRVYFYDKNFSSWRPLPTRDFPREKFVRSLIHLPFARLAVLSDSDLMTSGRASWYAYKGGNFAASPDYPKGSKLRVYNLDNDKFVDVTINDYGPDRSLFPDRVIDLDKIAFSKIASLSAGVINVKIEALSVASSDSFYHETNTSEQISNNELSTNVRAAIIYNENTGETIFSKNATSTMPLASLTKLVSVATFFNTRPSLNQVVEYKYQDEAYNYEWCETWESARLRVKEGETMTIEDLVYSALVGSANNAIESLVRASKLTRPEFILKMNSLVKSWGAINTEFVEPTGLSPDNHTSAHDFALIMKNVFHHPIIEKISKTEIYEFRTINTDEYHRLKNTNKLLKFTGFEFAGSKTGYLDEALYCLATRVKANNGEYLIVVTLGAEDKNSSFSETEKLIKYGLKKISSN